MNDYNYNPFQINKTDEEDAVRFYKLRDWVIEKAEIKKRLRIIFLWYLLSLMVETRKHSLTFASVLSALSSSSVSCGVGEGSSKSSMCVGSDNWEKSEEGRSGFELDSESPGRGFESPGMGSKCSPVSS